MPKLEYSNYGRSLLSTVSTGDPVEDDLLSMVNLPVGWHYGRGQAPSEHVVLQALSIMVTLRQLGISKFETFPTVNGQVMVSGFFGTDSIDVTTVAPGKVTYVVERNDIEIAAQDVAVEFSVLLDAIIKQGWLGCSSSDLSTQGTIATKRAGLPQWHSATQMAQGFQWLANAA